MSHFVELRIEEDVFTEPSIQKVLDPCKFIFPLYQC